MDATKQSRFALEFEEPCRRTICNGHTDPVALDTLLRQMVGHISKGVKLPHESIREDTESAVRDKLGSLVRCGKVNAENPASYLRNCANREFWRIAKLRSSHEIPHAMNGRTMDTFDFKRLPDDGRSQKARASIRHPSTRLANRVDRATARRHLQRMIKDASVELSSEDSPSLQKKLVTIIETIQEIHRKQLGTYKPLKTRFVYYTTSRRLPMDPD